MDRVDAMRLFLKVVETGSLSAAARALHSPLPTVSRKIAEMERLLGAKLIIRTNRNVALTDAGRLYLSAAKDILERIDEAERRVSGEYLTPKGDLTMTAPIVFGRLHVLPVVTDFLRAFPEINMRLTLSDRNNNLVEDQIDLALRIGDLADSSLMALRFGAIRSRVYGSPKYLQQHNEPLTPHDLSDQQCIAFEGVQSSRSWQFSDGQQTFSVDIRPRLSVNTAEAAVDAAASGLGLTRVMSYQASNLVEQGLLKPVLEQYELPASPVHLIYLPSAIMPLKLRAFLDFATPRLRSALQSNRSE
ncbi:LysR family transcriptional regulator [Agrobacterium albertimagni AOL15]|uniref:HTH-type transcriptional regulator TtuA n=1 Tax=Agrobacterium albertimagni AOL15 TaxID=1156935 RepID=K2Q937_9HYPH|nr:LysR family transcriptional regulator [Agrobacterium albertimagni]EKF61680.1 LysR family transcriptional regulator [Agrobacterium albertimagni AOL15]